MIRTILLSLTLLFSCSRAVEPVAEDSYFPDLKFKPVNTGQFPVLLAIDAEPENLTVEVWYYPVTENTDESRADVMEHPNVSADDTFTVTAKGDGFSNYNSKKQIRAFFDEAALVVLRVKSEKQLTVYRAFTTTGKNQIVWL